MNSLNLSDYLEKISKQSVKVSHELGYWADLTAKMLNVNIGQVLGLTRYWKKEEKVERIRSWYLESKKDEKPAMRWWVLRKQFNEKQKCQKL